MADLFNMPGMPKACKEMPIYRTAPKAGARKRIRRGAREEKIVQKYAAQFGMEAKPKDAGSRIVIKNRSAILEIFKASGSVWWTKQSRYRSERRKSGEFPGDREAIARSNAYLKKTGLAERKAKPKSVSYSEVHVDRGAEHKFYSAVTQQHVNYGFELDGFSVFGPGAKIQVTFAGNEEVVECLKFWRQPRKEREGCMVISAEQATEMFQKLDAFSKLTAKKAKVQVSQIELGYYALPPRELQLCLFPVYRFKGFVATELVERYEFVKYIIAVDMPPEDLKRMGLTITGARQAI